MTSQLLEQGKELLEKVRSLGSVVERGDRHLGAHDLYLEEKLVPAIANFFELLVSALPNTYKPKARQILESVEHLPLTSTGNELDPTRLQGNLNLLQDHVQAGITLGRIHWLLTTRTTLTENEAAEVLGKTDRTIRHYVSRALLSKLAERSAEGC